MSLKYNSREELENKLAVLKCCIGTKGIELSNSIALALGNTDCLVKDLEVLNKYYEILSCYYPYDCWSDDDFVTETCCNPKVIPAVYSYTLVTPQSLGVRTYTILATDITAYNSFIAGLTYADIYFNFSSLLAYPIGGDQVIMKYRTPGDWVTTVAYAQTYINSNPDIFRYRMDYAPSGGGNYLLTFTDLSCAARTNSNPEGGFYMMYTNTPNTNYVNTFGSDLVNVATPNGIAISVGIPASTCAVYSETIVHPETVECIENCLTDKQAEKMIRQAMSMCECCKDIYINNNLD